MQSDSITPDLLALFASEVEDQIAVLNRCLLQLEKETDQTGRAELLRTIFRAAHSLKGAAGSVNQPLIETAAHQMEDLIAKAQQSSEPPSASFFASLFTATDTLQQASRRLRATPATSDMRGALERMSERVSEAPLGAEPPPEGAGSLPDAPGAGSAPEFVRVSASRVEILTRFGGELTLARRAFEPTLDLLESFQEEMTRYEREWQTGSRLLRRHAGEQAGDRAASQRALLEQAMDRGAARLRRLQEMLDHLVGRLKRNHRLLEHAAAPLEQELQQARMLPFQEACAGLDRVVRDVTSGTNKVARLIIEGGDIELDRAVIERVKPALLHLVRNAVGHGIETKDQRVSSGKPMEGKIRVSASLRGHLVEITVSDDGGGIAVSAIRQLAERKGLEMPDDDLEVARMIFIPGFTTAATVTAVSGRGVGLDSVASDINTLHGRVDFSFEPGRGTTFRITVPLTLMTLRAVTVAAGDSVLAIASSAVERMGRASADAVTWVEGSPVVMIGESPALLAHLPQLLGLPSAESERDQSLQLVVIRSEGLRVALQVDECMSETELAIKSLGPRLTGMRFLSGAAMLADGRVALLLNPGELARAAVRSPAYQALAARQDESKPRKRLLLAEDSLTTRTLESTILEAAGYEVLAAVDGAEAWRLLQEHGADLVVTDLEMPHMDGLALTASIRESKRFRDVPVILLTSVAGDSEKARGMEAGANAYLLKSAFDQSRLLQTIEELL